MRVSVKPSHRRPRHRGNALRIALIGFAVVAGVAALSAWFGTSWLSTYRQAQVVEADLADLRGAIAAQNWSAVTEGVAIAKDSAAALVASTEVTQWQLLSSAPVVGASASAVHELAAGLDESLTAAVPLTPYVARIVARDVRRPDGSIDVDAIQEAAPRVQSLADALASASTRLSLVNMEELLPQIAGPVGELTGVLADVTPTVTKASEVMRLIPSMLGAEGSRNWLVLLQNPAEARGAGGFVGGYVVVRVAGGSMRIASSGTSEDLTHVGIPSSGAPAASRLLWGNMLQAWNTYNVGPDFPTNAQLSVAGMKSRGVPVTGVIALDPGAVAALLEMTGPVTADGVTITSQNVEQYFTVDIYSQIPDAAERDRVSMSLVRVVFTEILAADWDPLVMIDAIREPASRGGVQVWSLEPDEQRRLANSAVGGVLPDSAGSVIAVAFNNAAANKMDAYLQTEVEYSPGRCVTRSTQNSTVKVTVSNLAPPELPTGSAYIRTDDPDAPPGSNNTLVHIYAPVGANFLSATIDGKDAPLYLGKEFNRPVWWTYLPTERDQEREIMVHFEEPTVLGVVPQVHPQSMLRDEIISVQPNSLC